MKYGRYEIVKEVGRGAMGVVYQAHDPEIDRMIALKVLRSDRVASKALVTRFLKEAKAVGRLSHANIVTVYDIGHDHDTIYIAMEFLEGTPLNEIIKHDDMTHAKIVELCSQMAEAVHYAHDKGIVHRDIKPTNIIVTPAGQAKITDFGIAHIEDPSATQQTQAGEILGTPVYMSPEQVMGKTVDGRSDLYSLGVILYELCTKKRPFTGSNLASVFRAITQDEPTPLSQWVPSLSPALETLVLKSLNKDPEKRFQTGKDLANALQSTLQAASTVQISESPARKKGPRSTPIVTVIILTLCAIGGFTYYFMAKKTPGPESASSLSPSTLHSGIEPEQTKRGRVRIDSEPSGAQVFFDGIFKGNAPLTTEAPLGKHEIRLSLPNHYEWEAQVQLQTEGETPLFVRLIPISENNP
jgi:serine/threonine-protein kinase